MHAWAQRLTAVMTRLFLTLIFGVGLAMLLAGATPWWVRQISALGETPQFYSHLFNSTLVAAGVICLTSRSTVGGAIDDLRGRGLVGSRATGVFRAAFTIEGVAFLGTGVVPMSLTLTVHNLFGICLLAGPLLLMLAGPTQLRALGTRHQRLTIGAAAAVTIAIVLFRPFALVNLTVMEFAVFGVTFVWLGHTVRALARLLDRATADR